MKRMKKWLSVLAAAAVAGTMFAGCGGSTDKKAAGGEEEKVLTVYTARSESLNNLVIPNFEKDTGIKVNVIVAGTGPLLKRVASEKGNPQGGYSLGVGSDDARVAEGSLYGVCLP